MHKGENKHNVGEVVWLTGTRYIGPAEILSAPVLWADQTEYILKLPIIMRVNGVGWKTVRAEEDKLSPIK